MIPNIKSIELRSGAPIIWGTWLYWADVHHTANTDPWSRQSAEHCAGKSGEAAAEEQGGLFASRHKTPQSKNFHSLRTQRTQFQIISESGQLNSKLLVKYSYQVRKMFLSSFSENLAVAGESWDGIPGAAQNSARRSGGQVISQPSNWQERPIIKPTTHRNILLAQKGTVAKVSDFGLSHSLYASVEELNNTSGGLPVRWMAPEVLMNRQVSQNCLRGKFNIFISGEQQEWHLVIWRSTLGDVQPGRRSLPWDPSNWLAVHPGWVGVGGHSSPITISLLN